MTARGPPHRAALPPIRTGPILKRAAILLVVLVCCGGAAFAALAWHPALPPTDRKASFAPDLVSLGARLAALGNCAACHSAPGEAPLSGGVPVQTPFGTVYGSNLTPDAETGIGRWSEAAFRRAMREGVSRDGSQLYPAFPYDHFTQVSDADDRALYAYLMSVPAARHVVPPPALPFPLNIRAVVAGWNLLFLHRGPFQPDPGHDAAWNRGDELVAGLGHCGACHTPRNALGAERRGEALSGGMAEGWNAYAINAASPAPVSWTADSLAFYLRHGWAVQHGVARGPMAVVTANLGVADPADVEAMAGYLVSLMPAGRAAAVPAPARGTVAAPSAGTQVAVVAAPGAGEGAAIYAGACASCHDSGRPVPFGGLPLALSSALHAPDPSNIVTVTLHGLAAPPGASGAIMPGFAGALDERQIVALLAYLRDTVAKEAPWPDLPAAVHRAATRPVTLDPSDGTLAAPADTDIRIAP